MLKIEKIKDEILNFNLANDNLRCYLARATTKQNCDIHECHRPNLLCEECLKVSLTNLLEEYKKPVKLSKFEYEYLKVAKKEGLNFIARDNDGCVFLYRNMPWKDELSWDYNGKFIIAFAELFKFVQWKDEESWEIDEILSNCEVMQDE